MSSSGTGEVHPRPSANPHLARPAERDCDFEKAGRKADEGIGLARKKAEELRGDDD